MRFKDYIYTVEELVNEGLLENPMDGNHGEIHPKASDYVDEGIPFIMANDLVDGKIDYKNCNYISIETARKLKKGFSKPNDVLITHKATIGRTAIVDDRFDYIILTPQITYYRIKSGINKYYLKYYFDSNTFQSLLYSWASSGSTRLYLGITAQRKLPIVLPPIEIQNNIAKNLRLFDKKIEINNKIIENLEAQAQAVFKSWFVDFEPFQDGNFVESELGLIPEGWEVVKLGDQLDLYTGFPFKSSNYTVDGDYDIITIKNILNGSVDMSTTRKISNLPPNLPEDAFLKKGDVLIAMTGASIGRVGLVSVDDTLQNQRIGKIISKNITHNGFFYALLRNRIYKEELINISSGSAQPNLGK